jgi:hypothetical protein
MEKVWLKEIKYDVNGNINCLKDKDRSKVYRLNNGDYLKLFPYKKVKEMRIIIADGNYDYESKILYGHSSRNIVAPKYAVYCDNKKKKFCGYVMEGIRGTKYSADTIAYKEKDKLDLSRYAQMYLKLEEVVKEANSKDIIIPDLCSFGNIILTSDNGDVKLIDYDGMQIGSYATHEISNVYINEKEHFFPKYRLESLYKDNLDKKSLMLLYFYNTLNLDPALVDDFTFEKDGKALMDYIGITDDKTRNKIGKYFDSKVDNEYLGSTVMDIANNYDVAYDNRMAKKLIKKR